MIPGAVLYFAPLPAFTSLQRHLLAIFAATVISLIAQPVPMGVSVLVAMSVDSHCRETRHFHVGETRHLYFEPTSILRSLGRYGACCARGLWKFSGLFTDRFARFCRLFSERLLRWRDGSICCAVSRRYRNANTLSSQRFPRSVASAWAGKECLTPPGPWGAR